MHRFLSVDSSLPAALGASMSARSLGANAKPQATFPGATATVPTQGHAALGREKMILNLRQLNLFHCLLGVRKEEVTSPSQDKNITDC